MRRDDEDDREAGRTGGPSWVDQVVVPDDIGELDAEVRALRRERRVQDRRARLRRLASPRGVVGPLVIVMLLLVAGVASLLVLFQPRRTASPTPRTTTGVADTDRMPDVPVRLADGDTRRIRAYQPAVFALAPLGCACDAALRDVSSAAARRSVRFLLVDRELGPLPAGVAPAAATRLVEPTGAVAERFGAERGGVRTPGGPVLVLVRPDGRARALPTAITARALDSELATLGAGAPTPTN